MALLATSWLLAGGAGWLVRLLALPEAVDDVELTVRAMALTGAGWLAHYLRELGQTDFSTAGAPWRKAGSAIGALGAWTA